MYLVSYTVNFESA